ncbi:MAG: cyclic nucleotide-binding domain-containing protein [Nitriliruptoraceae bacterium]
MDRLGAVPPFTGLDEVVVTAVAEASRVLRIGPGEHLVETGEVADALYVVLSGHFAAVAEPGDPDDTALARLGPGAVIGEIAVLTGGTRSATLRALEDAEVAAIDGERFVALLEQEPSLGAQLARTASDRQVATRLRHHLAELFPEADVAELAATLDRTDLVTLAPGEVLFSEGDDADAAYLVISGRVRVLRHDRDGTIVEPAGEVGTGELVGEHALLTEAPRDATVLAARRSQLARLPRSGFEAFLLGHPSTMLAVVRRLVARQEDTRREYARARMKHAAIAVVPVAPEVETGPLVTALAEVLSHTGSVSVVTATDVDAAVGLDGAAQADRGAAAELRVERWLDELEAETDLLLLLADPTRTPWSERCIDRADQVLLFAEASGDPEPTPAERALLPLRHLPHQRITLLLQHPTDADRPHGTAAWLAHRDVDDHLHVRAGHTGDVERLARYVSGRSVWLVLGGGGAKGFAHLGVVRAMAELGLPIDGIAGASVGAALGALVAMETPADELVDRTAELFRRVLDYTVPISGLIAAERIARAIERGVGDRDIEDTWLPYRCVSTNLTHSTTVVHHRGDLQRAMRASLSIPGVMPPVAFGEDLHVDGGVMNNLPVDVARRETPGGTVIASDVAPVLGPKAKGDHGLYVRGGGVLTRRLTPGVRAPRVPKLMPTLMRSLLVAAAQARDRGIEEHLADLHLQFELRGVGLLAFDVVEPVVERGYEEAMDALRTLRNDQRADKDPQAVGRVGD